MLMLIYAAFLLTHSILLYMYVTVTIRCTCNSIL